MGVHNAVKHTAVPALTKKHRAAMCTPVEKLLGPFAELSSSGSVDDTMPISGFPMPPLKVVITIDSVSDNKKDIDTEDCKTDGVHGELKEHKDCDEWFQKMKTRFELWSIDADQSVDGKSLCNKFQLLHRHPDKKICWQCTCLRRVLITVDQDGDGSIDLANLIQLVNVRNSPAMREVALALEFFLVEADTITIKDDNPAGKYVLFQNSKYCMDNWLALLLLYISIALPYTIAFYDDDSVASTLAVIANVINSFFIVDLISNFLTSYRDDDDREITQLRWTALHYLRVWLFIYLVSSMPTMQPAKMLKFGNLSKVFLLLCITRSKHLIACCEDQINELLGSIPCTISLGGLFMLVSAVFISDWPACFMLIVTTTGFLNIYAQEVEDSDSQKYIAALYWAMTTTTTVGYGDIVPRTTAERWCVMLAMIVSGAFYGYVIGSTVSLIHQANLNQEGYAEKMENVHAWLEFYKNQKCT